MILEGCSVSDAVCGSHLGGQVLFHTLPPRPSFSPSFPPRLHPGSRNEKKKKKKERRKEKKKSPRHSYAESVKHLVPGFFPIRKRVSVVFLKRIEHSSSQQLPTWDFKQICMDTTPTAYPPLPPTPPQMPLLPCSLQRLVYLFPGPFQLNFKEGFRQRVMTRVLQHLLNHNTRNQKRPFLFLTRTRPPRFSMAQPQAKKAGPPGKCLIFPFSSLLPKSLSVLPSPCLCLPLPSPPSLQHKIRRQTRAHLNPSQSLEWGPARHICH